LWAWAIIAAGVGWYAWRKYKGQSATYQALIPNGIQPLGVPGGAFPQTMQDVPSMSADVVSTPSANGVGSSTLQGAATFTVPQLRFTSSVGSGTGGGGGGGGGLEQAGTVSGYSSDQVAAAAARYASGRSYGGYAYAPHMVMQEGHIEMRNGVPGTYIKYTTGPLGTSTEWTPL
jgi:hypothetical protein